MIYHEFFPSLTNELSNLIHEKRIRSSFFSLRFIKNSRKCFVVMQNSDSFENNRIKKVKGKVTDSGKLKARGFWLMLETSKSFLSRRLFRQAKKFSCIRFNFWMELVVNWSVLFLFSFEWFQVWWRNWFFFIFEWTLHFKYFTIHSKTYCFRFN